MTEVIIVNPEPEAPPEPEVIEVPVPVVVPEPEPEPEPAPVAVVPDYGGQVANHEDRLTMVEQRCQMMEANWVAMRGDLDGRAYAEHEHPVDEDLRIIADELKALRSEETEPRRGPQRGWLRRWLHGGNA